MGKSGLIAQDELDRRLSDFGKPNPFEPGYPLGALTRLVDQLVAEGLLTIWQCDKLRDGKWKGFFLDGYKVLSHLNTDDSYSYYLAEDVATGRQFAMRITPITRATVPGKLEFKIVREVL